MAYELSPIETCIYCHAEVFIQPDQTSVRCPACRGRMSVSPSMKKEVEVFQMREALYEQGNLHTEQLDAILTQIDQLEKNFLQSTDKTIQELFRQGEDHQIHGRFETAKDRYEELLVKNPTDAEVHWRILLCQFGVEYVLDASTNHIQPTVTNPHVSNLLTEDSYRCAIRFAPDPSVARFYEEEAKRIYAILMGYQKINGNIESPQYDVFITVKQHDDRALPTLDSQVATDICHELDKLHLQAFNSRLCLPAQTYTNAEEYESHIMHAVTTSKVMVLIASCEQYMNSPWVRSDWQRFRRLQANDPHPRKLIAYIIGSQRWDAPELGEPKFIYAESVHDTSSIRQLCASVGEICGHPQPVPETPSSPVVSIDDFLLKAVLFKMLKKNSITEADLASMTTLTIEGHNIQNIDVLHHCTQLSTLNLSSNQISDIRPLALLFNLKSLTLDANPIADLSPITLMDVLTTLSLNKVGHVDCPRLKQLSRLESLSLRQNNLSDLTELVNALTQLPNLTSLDLSDNKIQDIQPLSRLTTLKYLSIRNNQTALRGYSVAASLRSQGIQIQDEGVTYSDRPITNLSVPKAETKQTASAQSSPVDSKPKSTVKSPASADSALKQTPQPKTDPQPSCSFIDISDAALEKELLRELGKTTGQRITQEDLASLTTLSLSGKGVSNISALKYCVNLQHLTLTNAYCGQQISDIRPLAMLSRLTLLDLSGNRIEDVSPLKGQLLLEKLYLHDNKIKDISPLQSLFRLTELGLNKNFISDIRPLKQLTNLKALYIQHNASNMLGFQVVLDWKARGGVVIDTGITYIDRPASNPSSIPTSAPKSAPKQSTPSKPVSQPSGSFIDIADAVLENELRNALGKSAGQRVSREDLASLTTLSIQGKGVSDIGVLKYCSNLQQLVLTNAYCAKQISDIRPLAMLSQLTMLDLSGNQIEDISPLKGQLRLKKLYLHDNKIKDIAPLKFLSTLTELGLSKNVIYDVRPLKSLSKLKNLLLQHNAQEMLGFEAISALKAQGCTIVDTGIRYIDRPASKPVTPPACSFLDISDMALEKELLRALGKPMGLRITKEDLASLPSLTIQAKGISDIGVLKYCTNLQQLVLTNAYCGRQISDIRPLAQLSQLTMLDLSGNRIEDISPLKGLPRLTKLYLHDNKIKDISSLQSLTTLTELGLSKNAVYDVRPLKPLTKLKSLLIQHNAKEMLGFETISALKMQGCAITDTGIRYIDQPSPRPASTPVTPSTSPFIDIADAVLEKELLKALKKPTGKRITKEDLASLTTLNITGKGISDIGALKYCTNLQQLVLTNAYCGKQISDIRPLAQLSKLTMLDLSGNHINDVSPLKGQLRLTKLYLHNNLIVDISPLQSLSALTELGLSKNLIADVRPLKQLTQLKNLYIQHNSPNMLGFQVISALKAQGCTVSDTGITYAFVPVEIKDKALEQALREQLHKTNDTPIYEFDLHSITELTLKNKGITDITPLRHCTKLQTLTVSNFGTNQPKLTDISPLSQLTTLQSLDLSNNRISDISILSNLTNLRVLQLHNNEISDISPLTPLDNLEVLYLSNNHISQIHSLFPDTDEQHPSKPNLSTFYLAGNSVSDIFCLAKRYRLQDLGLSGNPIGDLLPLAKLPHLLTLHLGNTSISDITPLTQISTLRTLTLPESLSNRKKLSRSNRLALDTLKTRLHQLSFR